jgi:cytoskeletal protein RodZ
MSSLASELRDERERRNITLAHIAEETRISLRHLQSLEEGRYADMPGGIYNRAFIKAYCDVIGLDSQPALQKYDNELSPHPEKPAKSQTFQQPRKSFRGSHSVMVWSLMFILLAAGIFFSRKFIIPSPHFTNASASAFKQDSSEPLTEARPQYSSIPSQSSQSSPEPAINPDNSKNELEPPAYSPSDSASLHIEFEVTEKSWISVVSDNEHVISKIFEPGEAQKFSASQQFKIIIGNAGGVQLRINGQPAKPLGKPGEVVKKLINYQNLPDLIKPTAG